MVGGILLLTGAPFCFIYFFNLGERRKNEKEGIKGGGLKQKR